MSLELLDLDYTIKTGNYSELIAFVLLHHNFTPVYLEASPVVFNEDYTLVSVYTIAALQ